jgi:predicted membrane protein
MAGPPTDTGRVVGTKGASVTIGVHVGHTGHRDICFSFFFVFSFSFFLFSFFFRLGFLFFFFLVSRSKKKENKKRKKENACVFQSQAETNDGATVSHMRRVPYRPA